MIAILDYEAGNLTSVKLAVEHLGIPCVITRNPKVASRADKIIFPGVGAAGYCMKKLKNFGLADVLRNSVTEGKPVLAICLGIQLLFESSAEDGEVECLGILPGKVEKFIFSNNSGIKIPHMGWNSFFSSKPHQLLTGVRPASEFYFVHSYYVVPSEQEIIVCETEYGGCVFPSVISHNNLVATQFHPEKSGEAGLTVLRNFLTW